MPPALFTRLRFRVTLWWAARTLPFRVGNQPLNAVLKLAQPDPAMPYRGLPLAYVLKRVRRTARRPLLMRDRRCLREGLLAFRFLNAAGYDPELHFGIDRTSLPGPRMKAHCWIVQDGDVVLNPPNENTTPIYIHRGTVSMDNSATRVPNAASFD